MLSSSGKRSASSGSEAALLPQRLERQVGVDRVGAVADETAVVVHLSRLAGFDDDSDPGALLGGNQMMVHGAGRQQRAHRDAVWARLGGR